LLRAGVVSVSRINTYAEEAGPFMIHDGGEQADLVPTLLLTG
jgi:hypothetical protein